MQSFKSFLSLEIRFDANVNVIRLIIFVCKLRHAPLQNRTPSVSNRRLRFQIVADWFQIVADWFQILADWFQTVGSHMQPSPPHSFIVNRKSFRVFCCNLNVSRQYSIPSSSVPRRSYLETFGFSDFQRFPGGS